MRCSQFYLYRSCERKWFVLLCVRWPLSHARACRDVRTYLNLLNLPEAAWYAVATFIDLRQHWVATCIQALLLLFCLFHIDADTLVTRGYTCTWSQTCHAHTFATSHLNKLLCNQWQVNNRHFCHLTFIHTKNICRDVLHGKKHGIA